MDHYNHHHHHTTNTNNTITGINTTTNLDMENQMVNDTRNVHSGISYHDTNDTGTGTTTNNSGGGGGGYSLGGFMGRVFTGAAYKGGPNANQQIDEDDLSISQSSRLSRTLRPPRKRCVASANGWIVAAIECPISTTNSTSTTTTNTTDPSSMNNHNNHHHNTNTHIPNSNPSSIPKTHSQPPLRLVSRWNVRRGSISSTSSSSDGQNSNAGMDLIPLPPPVHAILPPSSNDTNYTRTTNDNHYPPHSHHYHNNNNNNNNNNKMSSKRSTFQSQHNNTNITTHNTRNNNYNSNNTNHPNPHSSPYYNYNNNYNNNNTMSITTKLAKLHQLNDHGQIQHVFVDPTGSHVLLSAINGEAYHIHSGGRHATKLKGFGPLPDGRMECARKGCALNDLSSLSNILLPGRGGGGNSNGGKEDEKEDDPNEKKELLGAGTGGGYYDGGGYDSKKKKNARTWEGILGEVQLGLTPGSYVTSVAWDRARGTEGSSKKILLGTSMGEIYEYRLISSSSSSHTAGGGGGGGGTSGAGSSGNSVDSGGGAFGMGLAGSGGAAGGGSGNDASSSSMNDGTGLDGGMGGTSGIGGGMMESYGYGLGGGFGYNSNSTAGGTTASDDLPLLLAKLNATEGSIVSGLHFERSVMTNGNSRSTATIGGAIMDDDLVVLAATSGRNKRTRLHTFRSISSPSSLQEQSSSSTTVTVDTHPFRGFKRVFMPPLNTKKNKNSNLSSSSTSTFVELPGSIDYADLEICNDGFALRTETGIYYGTIEGIHGSSTMGGKNSNSTSTFSMGKGNTPPRMSSLNLPSSPSSTSSNLLPGSLASRVLVDVGLLPYESIDDGYGILPSSIALTPHHFVTLEESSNLVYFVDRIACKTIQRELMDWNHHNHHHPHGTGEDGGKNHNANSSNYRERSSSMSLMGNGELLTDPRRVDQIWLRGARSLIHISSTCEDRNVWKYALVKCLSGNTASRNGGGTTAAHGPAMMGVGNNNYREHDAKFAQIPCANDSQRAVVMAARAEYHFGEGRIEMAAKCMAQCPPCLMPFDKTAIRLALAGTDGIDTLRMSGNYGGIGGSVMGGGLVKDGMDGLFSSPSSYSTDANSHSKVSSYTSSPSNAGLIAFLSDKMRSAKARNDGVACTMIGAWLAELFLHEKERHPTIGYSAVGSGNSTLTKRGPVMEALWKQFLSTNVTNMDAKLVLRILASHDCDAVDCSEYAAASGDVGTAVSAALCMEDATNGALDALNVLNDAPLEQSEPIYYRYALTLLERAPTAASKNFLSKYSDGLNATKLLPAFMRYEKKRSEVREHKANAALKEKNPAKQSKDGTPTAHEEEKSTYVDSDLDYLTIQGNASKIGIDDGGGFEISLENESKFSRSTKYNNEYDNSAFPNFVDDPNASARYLEGVITLGCKSTAIYNYLVSLYAALEDEEPLYKFLSAHVGTPQPPTSSSKKSSINNSISSSLFSSHTTMSEALLQTAQREASTPLDMSYALRTILKTGRHYRSAVKLYMGFGLRERAVELAIKVDPELARELAREPRLGMEEKKRLWLMIARHAAIDAEEELTGGQQQQQQQGRHVVEKVLNVLNDCGPDVLSIEDVLPFLPDVAQIDQFKDEICYALTSYSSKIDKYLKDMSDCDQTCNALRSEISSLNEIPTFVDGNATCSFTGKSVFLPNGAKSEPFYVFPSGYIALESSLRKEVLPHLNKEQRDNVTLIDAELAKLKSRSIESTSYGTEEYKGETKFAIMEEEENARLRLMEDLQCELDGLIAAECPFTGNFMVDSINRGFEDVFKEDEMYASLTCSESLE